MPSSDAVLIVLSNYLIESRAQLKALANPTLARPQQDMVHFPQWLKEHGEIKTVLGRRTLD